MDTSDNINNSIAIIVDKCKEHLPHCMGPNNIPSLPFKFPLGHKAKIKKFISDIKNNVGMKSHQMPTTSKKPSKCRKHQQLRTRFQK